jgi:hypothetical protein
MSGTGRLAAVLLTVTVLLGAVVVAAGGRTPVGEGGSREPSEWLLDVLVSLLLVQMAFGAVLCVVLLVLRPEGRLDPSGGRKRGRVLVGSVLVVLLVLFVFAARRFADNPDGLGSGLFGGSSAGGAFDEAKDRYEPSFATVPVIVVLTLLALAAAALVVARRARRAEIGDDETLQAALEEALDDSLDDLRAETDPRRAVIAAYARLERVLAAHGVPRHPSEAPDEYLHRVLSSLELSRRAVSRLTALFQTAKFSHHDVDDHMKEEAIDALVSARDELRAARERAEAARCVALEHATGQAST